MQIHLPSIANTLGSVLAGKVGVNVSFDPRASTASINGQGSVVLPTFVQYGGENEAAMLRGFLAHEIIGHHRHTDFKFLATWCPKQSPLCNAVRQIIEDVFIERASWKIFPGSRRILKECVAALVRRGGFFDMPRNEEPASVLVAYLLVALRAKELDQPLDPLPFAALATKVFGKDLRDSIMKIATKGSKGTCSQDTCKAAEQIMKLLEQAGQDQPQKGQSPKSQKSEGQGQQGDTGEPGSQDKSEGGESKPEDKKGKEDGQQQGKSKGQNGDGEPDKGEGQSEEGQADGGSNASPVDAKTQKAAKQALAAGESQIGKTDLGAACADILVSQNSQTSAAIHSMSRMVGWRPDMQAMAAARKMGAKLELLLQAKTEEESILGKRGKLVSKRLARTRVLDFEVFEEEGDEAEGLNTAITFLIDRSGSMNTRHGGSSRMEMAKITAAAVGEALSRFETQGIAVSMYSFNDTCFLMKDFGVAWRQGRETIGSLCHSGGTTFQDSLLAVSQGLARRPEKRKVVFCVTDGDLGQNPAPVIETMRSQGIEVRAVFIGTARSIEPIAKVANLKFFGLAEEPKDVPKAVFSSLEGVF